MIYYKIISETANKNKTEYVSKHTKIIFECLKFNKILCIEILKINDVSEYCVCNVYYPDTFYRYL